MFWPTRSFVIFFRYSVIYFTVMTLCRFLFYIFNQDLFLDTGLIDYAQGLRFDAVSGAFGLSLLWLAMIFAANAKWLDSLKKWMNGYFIFVMTILTLSNCIDIIYYRFTLKRTTFDIFRLLGKSEDIGGLVPTFLSDFWYIALVWILLLGLIFYSVRWVWLKKPMAEEKTAARLVYSLLIAGLLIIGVRGGLQLKPINIRDAAKFSSLENAALVLNSPFAMMKTIGVETITLVEYMDSKEAKEYFNPEQVNLVTDKFEERNIVVLILESFSKEYIGYYNNGKGYTPFLDSLFDESIVFENAYANGKRSIEALPAIFSSLPNLMNEAYNTTPYAGNRLNSMASLLKQYDYTSHFFHGGMNGTMAFDSYTSLAGFDFYYGLNEYPNMDDYDGNWGIFDEPYLKYVAEEQNNFKQPFMCGIFTLSAHHPYTLPDNYKNKCMEAGLEIHPLICYTDHALEQYFKSSRNTEWFQNSIFVITADHTAQYVDKKYGTNVGVYSIPLAIYDPQIKNHISIEKTSQQTDITPTVLSYINAPYEGVFFGHNALDSSNTGFAINFKTDIYQLITDKFAIQFNGNEVSSVYQYYNDPLLKENLINQDADFQEDANKLKAIVQQYNQRLIMNELTYD